MKHISFVFALFVLSACATGQGISLFPYQDKNESPYSFDLCHGFGCKSSTAITLSEKDWDRVQAPLKKKSKNAEDERKKIAKAISRMEKTVQQNSGMNADFGEARTFEKDYDQMDCLDETINTSRVLAFLDREGLIQYHSVANPVHRGYFLDGMWPHNSAAIEDKESGEVFAVDSYYFDNGEKVNIVPLKIWMDEWRPPELRRKIVPPTPKRKPVFKS